MKWLTIVMLSFAVSVAEAAPGLLVTSDGYYAVTVDASGKPSYEKITQVMDLRVGAPPGGGGGGGGGGPAPPTDSLQQRITTMSKGVITDSGEATALAAGLALLLKANSDEGLKTAFDLMIPIIGGSTNSLTRMNAWYAGLQQVQGFTFTKASMQATYDALVKGYNIDPTNIGQMLDIAMGSATTEEAVDKFSAAFPDAAFDIAMLMSIIMALIEILQKLGLF